MKAEINRHGCLTVYPETELEMYALREWSYDYMGGGCRKNVCFAIATGDEYLDNPCKPLDETGENHQNHPAD